MQGFLKNKNKEVLGFCPSLSFEKHGETFAIDKQMVIQDLMNSYQYKIYFNANIVEVVKLNKATRYVGLIVVKNNTTGLYDFNILSLSGSKLDNYLGIERQEKNIANQCKKYNAGHKSKLKISIGKDRVERFKRYSMGISEKIYDR